MNRLRRLLLCGFVVLVFMFTAGCGTTEKEKTPVSQVAQSQQQSINTTKEGTSATQASQTTPEPENKPAKNSSYEEWLRKTITETIGEKSNTGKPRIESILFMDKDKTNIEITLWADDNLTAGFIRDDTIVNSAQVLRRIFSDLRAKRVLLYWLFPVKDSYGNDKQMVIMQVVMTRETANKINWSGFNPLNLPDVADKFHVHPSLQ